VCMKGVPGVRGPMLYYWKKKKGEEIGNTSYEKQWVRTEHGRVVTVRETGGKHAALETLEGETARRKTGC
jgi:hypothetical protein